MRQVAPGGARTGGSQPTAEEMQLLFRRMRSYAPVPSHAEQAMADMFAATEHVREYRVALRRGQHVDRTMLVLEGVLCRFRDFPNGTRQITALYLPGDFVDLASYTLKRTDQDVLALTNCRLAIAPHSLVTEALERCPEAQGMLWLLSNVDASINREWQLSLGQRSALERTAHLFCELHSRLGAIGQAAPDSFAVPMTQIELSQCLAISSVHINRVLRELRERNLLHFVRRRAHIADPAALRHLAGFDPAYLHIDPVYQ